MNEKEKEVKIRIPESVMQKIYKIKEETGTPIVFFVKQAILEKLKKVEEK